MFHRSLKIFKVISKIPKIQISYCLTSKFIRHVKKQEDLTVISKKTESLDMDTEIEEKMELINKYSKVS